MQVADMSPATVNSAVAAAVRAQPAWAAETAQSRSSLLMELHNLMVKHADSLATLLSLECGKPLAEAKGEVAYSCSFLKWYAEEILHCYGDIIQPPRSDRRMLAMRGPVG
jgi:succinate-semialdehyde dehydrogenase / glutarate-semialdehyde dehydrogenase